MKKIQQKKETNPLSVLRQAIHGVTPGIAVKTRRVGGSTHQVPIEIEYIKTLVSRKTAKAGMPQTLQTLRPWFKY
ncbi:hypothetical protein R6Q59_002205 [Mikania micrantha]